MKMQSKRSCSRWKICKRTISTCCSCIGRSQTITRGLAQLGKLYTEGKVRAIGVSNFEPDQLLDLIAYNKVVPAVNQIETNLYCQRTAERGWMDKSRVAHMAYSPLGQGNRSEMFKEPAVLALAEKYGKTPAQIQLRFLTQKGIAVIPRSTQPAHIRENFALFDFALTAEEWHVSPHWTKKNR